MKKYESVIDSIFLSNNGEIDLLTGAISPDRFDQIVKRDLAMAQRNHAKISMISTAINLTQFFTDNQTLDSLEQQSMIENELVNLHFNLKSTFRQSDCICRVSKLGFWILLNGADKRTSDQLFEALYFAAKFGSRNTIKVLRELSEYVSADLSVRAEINTRFGWIKNSANLAALAPWLLFLILRTQINAKVAYEQPFGQFLMAIGVLATLIAYYWMNRIANLPKAKRIFTLALGEK